MLNSITDKKNKLERILIMLTSVIFFFLSFSLSFNFIVCFVLGILLLGLNTFLSYKEIKSINYTIVILFVIPLLAYSLISVLGYYSREYLAIESKVMIPFAALIFFASGIMISLNKKIDFKLIFEGLFIALSIICIINFIATMVNYGPFYGIKYDSYYTYYDGDRSANSLSSYAYGLSGFSLKQIPIENYLIYPCLLLISFIFFVRIKHQHICNYIFPLTYGCIALISLIFVISRVIIIPLVIYLLFVALLVALFIFPKIYNKVFKISLITIGSLLFVFAFIFVLNSQFGLTGLRNALSGNSFLNYLFNTNRFSNAMRYEFNNLTALFGFPIYFDMDYEVIVYPSHNIFANQLMYGGTFGLIFFIFAFVALIYCFIKVSKKELEKVNKYTPFIFIMMFYLFSFFEDIIYLDAYNLTKLMPTTMNPFFYICVIFSGYYVGLFAKEENVNEE